MERKLTNLYMDMSNPYNRILRRAIVMGILTALSVALAGTAKLTPEYAPIIMAFLAMTDKALHELKS